MKLPQSEASEVWSGEGQTGQRCRAARQRLVGFPVWQAEAECSCCKTVPEAGAEPRLDEPSQGTFQCCKWA